MRDLRLGAKDKVLRDKNGLSWADKREKIILEYFGFAQNRKIENGKVQQKRTS